MCARVRVPGVQVFCFRLSQSFPIPARDALQEALFPPDVCCCPPGAGVASLSVQRVLVCWNCPAPAGLQEGAARWRPPPSSPVHTQTFCRGRNFHWGTFVGLGDEGGDWFARVRSSQLGFWLFLQSKSAALKLQEDRRELAFLV